MSVFDAAIAYTRWGWKVLPIPFRSKNPGKNGWQRWRLSEAELADRFNGKPQNLGVLLGEPSGWLIDIDLDHALAVASAPDYLPATSAIFGRAGKSRSHWLYRVSSPLATKKYRSRSAGMLVEIRSTGAQTVFPPSTHESGEIIEWNSADHEPTLIEPDDLVAAVERLVDAVRVELGERPARRPKILPPKPTPSSAESDSVPLEERALRCLKAMLRMLMVDHNDGSCRLYACACRVVDYDLDDANALEVIRKYTREKPFIKNWTEDEIVQRIRQAERRCERGKALKLDADGCVPLGSRDPETGRVVLSPKRTLPTAEAYVREFCNHPEGPTLFHYAGVLWRWKDNCYRHVEDQALRKQLQKWLHDGLRYVFNRSSGEQILLPFESNPTTVKAALESIQAFTHLPETTPTPSWLVLNKELPSPTDLVACRSELLYLPTLRALAPTPTFFATCALDFDYDPSAPLPTAWFKFLHQLFDGDSQALDLLQEWFGYCLTGDTSLQKMLLIVGPRRSGKGTIARVLRQLVGVENVAGPTTSGLAGSFGLQPLIGKTLAIVSDARFHGENVPTVVERLLCISGEDALTIDRKYLSSVTMKLPTRFLFLSNELPRLTDASGALIGRFLILQLTRSFYGQEDPRLTDKLLAELPGILNWAIAGWQRLRARGHLVMPASVEDAARQIENLSSPVAAFVRDRCVVGPHCRIRVDELYEAWRWWCSREGCEGAPGKQAFGRDLAAAAPGVVRRRGTDHVGFYQGIGLKEVEHG